MTSTDSLKDLPFFEELEDLKLSVQATTYKKTLISIQLQKTKDLYTKENKKMEFLPHIKFTKPPFVNDAWFTTQCSHLENLQKHIYLRYIEEMEKQISFLQAVLFPATKGPLLLPFSQRIKKKSLSNWGVADDDHVTKQGVVDAAIDIAQEHWKEWMDYGCEKAYVVEDLIGTPGTFSLPHPYVIANYC